MRRPQFQLGESETTDGSLRLRLMGTLDIASAPDVEMRLHELRILARRVRLDLSRLEAPPTMMPGARPLMSGSGGARRSPTRPLNGDR